MKTRQQIYENEAARILRDITTYHHVSKEQIIRLHPEIKPEVTEKILFHLQNNRRIFYDKQTQMLYDTVDRESDIEMKMCLWVLCDFIEETDFHSVGDFPVHLLFFMKQQIFEVTFIAEGKETVYEQILSEIESDGKRIIVLESEDQISRLRIPDVAAYCTVKDETGEVKYFKKGWDESG